MSTSADGCTQIVERDGQRVLEVPRFRVLVTAGPDAGQHAESVEGRLVVGSAEGAHLQLTDRAVSRFHFELTATEVGIVVRDLGSTNGTHAAGVLIREVVTRTSLELGVGRSRLRLELRSERAQLPLVGRGGFGRLIGTSSEMRAAFSTLARASPTTASVLITGESGTGKELAARAIHEASPRASQAFEVVDCGGLPATLIESELFGHERGAFTSALKDRAGAFERADGGTLFLDELGELPLEVQPKLLRALGEREVRRVGGSRTRSVDVRVVAATNRDLRRDVNAGRFRSDLFYRLAVIEVRMPALRERLDDLPALVATLLEQISKDRELEVHVEPDAALLETLRAHSWPGNVRELRNYLEQLLILEVAPSLSESDAAPLPLSFDGLEQLPLRRAKAQLVERFECEYVTRLLQLTSGNVAEAARRAGVDRGTLFRTIRRHGLREP